MSWQEQGRLRFPSVWVYRSVSLYIYRFKSLYSPGRDKHLRVYCIELQIYIYIQMKIIQVNLRWYTFFSFFHVLATLKEMPPKISKKRVVVKGAKSLLHKMLPVVFEHWVIAIKHWLGAWQPQWKNQAPSLLAAANRNSGLGSRWGERQGTVPARPPVHWRPLGVGGPAAMANW